MSERRKNRTPVPLGEAVTRLLGQLGVNHIVNRHSIWSCWEEIVGNDVASHTEPEFFSGSCLFITVDHPAWMHQLNFLKEQILENLRKKLGSQTVSEIRFRLGILPDRSRSGKGKEEESVSLSKDEEDEIRMSIGPIASSEVQETLYNLMRKDRLAKKARKTPPNP